MKISISINTDATKFFNPLSLTKALNQNSNSRETLVYMSPAEFLNLVPPSKDDDKYKELKSKVLMGTKFEDLPYLDLCTNKKDDVYIDGMEGDQVGRSQVMVLKELGIKEIPVKIISKPLGQGPAFRWGQTNIRPEKLIGHNGFTIPFPETETFK